VTDTEDKGATPPKKTWRDLIGAFDDVDSPGNIAERHDYYLARTLPPRRSMPRRVSPTWAKVTSKPRRSERNYHSPSASHAVTANPRSTKFLGLVSL